MEIFSCIFPLFLTSLQRMYIILVIVVNGKLHDYSSEIGFPPSPAPDLILCFLPLAPWLCLAFRVISSTPNTHSRSSSLGHLIFHGTKFQRGGEIGKPGITSQTCIPVLELHCFGPVPYPTPHVKYPILADAC